MNESDDLVRGQIAPCDYERLGHFAAFFIQHGNDGGVSNLRMFQ